MRVRVQQEPFAFGAEAEGFASGVSGAGAIVTFTGVVRDLAEGLAAMEIEHYPGMTERAIEAIRAEAVARWGLSDAMVIHRHGRLRPGEAIMMVATAAPHRADAFAAAEFLMDYLKSRAPFWKKEHVRSGTAAWVAARDEDEAALGRWGKR
ncbi:MAG: molybdenum cofactor biosynthesis protein MoaE [Gemmobacter sp.]